MEQRYRLNGGTTFWIEDTANGTREYTFKILMLGDSATGKTSLLTRLKTNTFSKDVKSTVGVDFVLKDIKWDSKTLVHLQLWDVAGQQRFDNLARIFYRDAIGAFIAFDVNRTNTFENTRIWKEGLDKVELTIEDQPIPVVLLANKCDLMGEKKLDAETMDKFCERQGFTGWEKTSAASGENVDKAAVFMTGQVLSLVNNIIKGADVDASSPPKDLRDDDRPKPPCCLG